MGDFTKFQQLRRESSRSAGAVSSLRVLGLGPDARCVHVLWMYPDILNMHGGRGDAMALLQWSIRLELPLELRRIDALGEEIPLDWADMILFPSGDLCCMEDVSGALGRYEAAFRAFAAAGKVILAVGSSGALLARQTRYLSGHTARGLGLLGMEWTQRNTAFGDDLWVQPGEGPEFLALQVQMADVTLLEGQEALGATLYGRGNCGDGREGARTGNVIFTHALGPVLPRNPKLAEYLLKLAAGNAGIRPGRETLGPEDTELETAALAEVRAFVEKKLRGEIR